MVIKVKKTKDVVVSTEDLTKGLIKKKNNKQQDLRYLCNEIKPAYIVNKDDGSKEVKFVKYYKDFVESMNDLGDLFTRLGFKKISIDVSSRDFYFDNMVILSCYNDNFSSATRKTIDFKCLNNPKQNPIKRDIVLPSRFISVNDVHYYISNPTNKNNEFISYFPKNNVLIITSDYICSSLRILYDFSNNSSLIDKQKIDNFNSFVNLILSFEDKFKFCKPVVADENILRTYVLDPVRDTVEYYKSIYKEKQRYIADYTKKIKDLEKEYYNYELLSEIHSNLLKTIDLSINNFVCLDKINKPYSITFDNTSSYFIMDIKSLNKRFTFLNNDFEIELNNLSFKFRFNLSDNTYIYPLTKTYLNLRFVENNDKLMINKITTNLWFFRTDTTFQINLSKETLNTNNIDSYMADCFDTIYKKISTFDILYDEINIILTYLAQNKIKIKHNGSYIDLTYNLLIDKINEKNNSKSKNAEFVINEKLVEFLYDYTLKFYGKTDSTMKSSTKKVKKIDFENSEINSASLDSLFSSNLDFSSNPNATINTQNNQNNGTVVDLDGNHEDDYEIADDDFHW